MKPATSRTATHLTYTFWLTFDVQGGMKMSRGQPIVGRGERAMQCSATLPRTLFDIPTMRAQITITDPGEKALDFDLHATGDALRKALGVDVDLQIVQPPEALT
jgi:hypothetical protein